MVKKRTRVIIIGVVTTLVLSVITGVCLYLFSGNEFENALPRDMKAIARIDVKTLVMESDAEVGDVLDYLRNGDQPSGIDLMKPLYSFVSPQGDLGLLVALDNESEFHDWLVGKGCVIEQQRGMSWTYLNDSWLVCYDDKKAMILGPYTSSDAMNARNQVALWMKQDREESGVTTAIYDSLSTMQGGVTIVASLDMIPASYSTTLKDLLPKGVGLQDILFSGQLNVKQNEVTLNVHLYSNNPQIETMLDELNAACRPAKGELTSFTPAYPFMWMTTNVSGDKVLQLFRKSPILRTALIALNMGVDADMMLRSIDGDVSVTMPRPLFTNPEVLLTAQLSNEKFLDNSADWKQGMANDNGFRIVEPQPHQFYCSTGDFDAYFGVREHMLYVTPCEKLADLACKGQAPTGMESMLEDMKASILYVYVDLSQVTEAITVPLLLMGTSTSMMERATSLQSLTISASDSRHLSAKLTAKTPIISFN